MLIDAFSMATLRRLRRYARFVFVVSVSASLGANYLHAPAKATAAATAIAATIAMWPSIALLLGTELVIRVPLKGAGMTLVASRVLGTVTVTGIAGWVSYRHMKAVAVIYGEGEGLNAQLFPLSVDGLMVVASVTLVQLNYMLLIKAYRDYEASKAAEASKVAATAVPVLAPVTVPAPVTDVATSEPAATVVPEISLTTVDIGPVDAPSRKRRAPSRVSYPGMGATHEDIDRARAELAPTAPRFMEPTAPETD